MERLVEVLVYSLGALKAESEEEQAGTQRDAITYPGFAFRVIFYPFGLSFLGLLGIIFYFFGLLKQIQVTAPRLNSFKPFLVSH